jgi:hypothetical protein
VNEQSDSARSFEAGKLLLAARGGLRHNSSCDSMPAGRRRYDERNAYHER